MIQHFLFTTVITANFGKFFNFIFNYLSIMGKLKEGDKAPSFSGKDQYGNEISLDQFTGKKIALYFYPKDNTPGCTAEACNLRDNHSELADKNYQVIGVSADNEESHKKFSSRYNLPFPLVADTDKKILHDYEAWGEKKMYGKTYEGILRKTFLIDENGIIEKIIDKVNTKNHSFQILST